MKAWIESKIVRRWVTVLNWALAITPIVLVVSLVAMAERGTRLLGKIPEPIIDDPKQFGLTDALYQGWMSATATGLILTIISWIPWCCLTALTTFFHCRYWLKQEPRSTATRFLPIALYLLAHGILFFEPFGLLAWFLD